MTTKVYIDDMKVRNFDPSTVTPEERWIMILTSVTALTHLILAIPFVLLFYIHAFAFMGLLTLFFIIHDDQFSLIRLMFIAYTSFSIFGYFIINSSDIFAPTVGIQTKLVEIGLVVLLQRYHR